MSNDLYLSEDNGLKCPTTCICVKTKGGVVQWVARLTRNRLMPVSLEPHQKASVVSLSSLPLFSTGWSQERILA